LIICRNSLVSSLKPTSIPVYYFFFFLMVLGRDIVLTIFLISLLTNASFVHWIILITMKQI
jgi:hypothetical protein